MLAIKPIMNSCVEDIFGFKTCCGAKAFDQNLEILLSNLGREPLEVPSRFELAGEFGLRLVEAVMPHGVHRIAPGETTAFYCTMDDALWQKARAVSFHPHRGWP